MMNKIVFTRGIAICLFLLNLVLLYFVFFGQKRQPAAEGPKKLIIDKLSFDDLQVVKYEKLIAVHRSEINGCNEEMFSLKRELYISLKEVPMNTDSIVAAIGEKQKQIEVINLNHFGDIRKLCHEDQLSKFNDLADEFVELFQPRKPKHD
jgi:hypothetical protein